MKEISKFKAIKIILCFLLSLIIIVGVLSVAIRSFMETGYHHIYLLILFMVLFNFTYIWQGKSQKNSFIIAVVVAVITSLILRFCKI